MKRILFLMAFLVSGCSIKHQNEIPYVNYKVVHLENIAKEKTLYGFIDRGLDVELSFGISGIMNEIYVNEGEFVKKGKLLAKLDNKEYKLAIEKAKSELDDAVVKYNRAKSYYERISKLHTAGGISFNDWEAAQTDLKSAQNQINIAKDSLETAISKETFSNIYAPYDGYIIKTYKDKMQFATVGDKVILFQGVGMPEARTFASQNDINDIKIGKIVTIRADAIQNKTYKGRIKSKTASSIKEGSYRVTISILGNPTELLDGMSISAIISEDTKKIISLPLNAIYANQEEKFVYVIDGNITKKRKIETGEVFDNNIEILRGINPGEKVITEGGGKIMDGMKIKYDY